MADEFSGSGDARIPAAHSSGRADAGFGGGEASPSSPTGAEAFTTARRWTHSTGGSPRLGQGGRRAGQR